MTVATVGRVTSRDCSCRCLYAAVAARYVAVSLLLKAVLSRRKASLMGGMIYTAVFLHPLDIVQDLSRAEQMVMTEI